MIRKGVNYSLREITKEYSLGMRRLLREQEALGSTPSIPKTGTLKDSIMLSLEATKMPL